MIMTTINRKWLPWIWSLLLWLSLSSAQIIKCGNCWGGSSLLCPNAIEMQFEVQIRNEELTISCNRDFSVIDFSLMNNCSFPAATKINFQSCPFTNESYSQIFSQIGVNASNVQALNVVIPSHSSQKLLKTHLEGLISLSYINFDSTMLTEISSDAFATNQQLKNLYLRGNDLRNLSANMFQHLPKLVNLYLTNDNISSVSAEAFNNLPELKSLNMWKNSVVTLPPNVFDSLEALQNLTLQSNDIQSLDKDLFLKNTELANVNLRRNALKTLPNGLFRNCSKLITVRFSSNKIENLPDDLFPSQPDLSVVEFYRNNLSTLPESFLDNLPSLTKLDLSYNKLENLSQTLFHQNDDLEEINLSNNLISKLSNDMFKPLIALSVLNLNNNSLHSLPENIFAPCKSLEVLLINKNNLTNLSFNSFPLKSVSVLRKVDFSYNQITSEGVVISLEFALNVQLQLEDIDFSYNNFTNFPDEANWFIFSKLRYLNFEGNNISKIFFTSILNLPNNSKLNLKHNRIQKLLGLKRALILFERKRVQMLLQGNNLTCNCYIYEFVEYLQKHKSDPSRLEYEPVNPIRGGGHQKKSFSYKIGQPTAEIEVLDKNLLTCREPEFLINETLISLDPYLLTCQMKPSTCSHECPCTLRPVDRMIFVDCSNKSMDEVPDMKSIPGFSFSLNLNRNKISGFDFSNDTNIVNLTLSNNNLKPNNLSQMVLPQKLKYLNLQENNLTFLPDGLLNQINETGAEIDLTRNPWQCDCAIQSLHNFMQAEYSKVIDIRSVLCHGSPPVALIDLTEDEICPGILQPTAIAIITAITFLLVAFAILATVSFYRYNTQIKVWLFTHRMCMWLVTEDELDVNKEFDAFISYSHKDEDFINNILLPGLENGDPKYRVCLHYRDWVVGEYIQNQIMNSVLSSRRTIVLLSANFIESVWGQMEFRAAHQQALQDKTNRVIVIVYGEVPPKDSLDKELRHYIEMYTYLKWGDPNFWEALRYAMPHPRHLLAKKKKRHSKGGDKIEMSNGHIKNDINAIRV